jgi:hypothetical protein
MHIDIEGQNRGACRGNAKMNILSCWRWLDVMLDDYAEDVAGKAFRAAAGRICVPRMNKSSSGLEPFSALQ